MGGDFAGLYSCKRNAKNKNVMLIFKASITTFKKNKNLWLIIKCPRLPAKVLTLFPQYLSERYDALVTQYFKFFLFHMPYWYIFSLEFLGFCDTINIKGVKWVFHYFGNVKGTPSIKKNNVLKLCLRISSITYISGFNGV